MTPPPRTALPRLLAAFSLAASLAYPFPAFAVSAPAPEEAEEGPAGTAAPAEPAAPPQAEACKGEACPSTAADWIFFRYGKDCAGLDWRFLRSAAKAQGELELPVCAANLSPFSSFLKCSQPSDPEAEAAASANRLHRYLAGRRDLGGPGGFPGILEACPDNAPADNAALAFLAIKVGPGVLRHVLKDKACKDPEIRKAFAGFYVGELKARLEPALKKYEEGRASAAGLGLQGPLYPAGPAKTTLCPAVTGKRLFTPEELAKLKSDGSFAAKPLMDPQAAAALASGSKLGASWEGAVSARLAKLNPAWGSREDAGGVPAGAPMGALGTGAGQGGATLPGSQLPSGFKTSSEPPPLDLPKVTLPSVVDNPVEVKPVGVKLTGPKEIKQYSFRGEKADAEAWTATYDDGATFAIIAPKGPVPGLHYHTVAQAADAARYLPTASRAQVKNILINRNVNPDDEYWAKQYKTKDFHSYMTAGKEGIVTIYPDKKEKALPGENYMRGAMIHETGHTWSYKTWGSNDTKGKWLVWKKAGADDKTWVSDYAKSSIAEDVAETFQVYGSALGAPSFKTYEKTTPNRFAMLAKELK